MATLQLLVPLPSHGPTPNILAILDDGLSGFSLIYATRHFQESFRSHHEFESCVAPGVWTQYSSVIFAIFEAQRQYATNTTKSYSISFNPGNPLLNQSLHYPLFQDTPRIYPDCASVTYYALEKIHSHWIGRSMHCLHIQ